MEIFYFWLFLVFHASYVNGEQSSCEVTLLENCPQWITYKIQEKLAIEGLSLTLFSTLLGKTETVAVLGFVGFYMCNPANGYTCETEDHINFVITTPCIPGIKFTISVDGGSPIPCTEKISQQTADSSTQNDTNCQEDKPEANSLDTNKHRNKRSAGVGCHDDSAPKEKDMIGEAVGISIGVGLLIVAAVIVVIVYFCRKRTREANPEAGIELQDENNTFLPGDRRRMNEAEEAEGSDP